MAKTLAWYLFGVSATFLVVHVLGIANVLPLEVCAIWSTAFARYTGIALGLGAVSSIALGLLYQGHMKKWAPRSKGNW